MLIRIVVRLMLLMTVSPWYRLNHRWPDEVARSVPRLPYVNVVPRFVLFSVQLFLVDYFFPTV